MNKTFMRIIHVSRLVGINLDRTRSGISYWLWQHQTLLSAKGRKVVM